MKGPARTYGPRSFYNGGHGLNAIREHLFCGGSDGWDRDFDGVAIYRLGTERRSTFCVWVPEHRSAACARLIQEAFPRATLVGTMRWRDRRALAFRYSHTY